MKQQKIRLGDRFKIYDHRDDSILIERVVKLRPITTKIEYCTGDWTFNKGEIQTYMSLKDFYNTNAPFGVTKLPNFKDYYNVARNLT